MSPRTPSTPTPRLLLVMRHARAAQSDAGDPERPLTSGGRADAAETGRWLAGAGWLPGHALVSSAVRTRQTWEALATAAGCVAEPDYDEGLYVAGPETALDLVRAVPEDVERLLVLGHNPTVASLAQWLANGEGDAGSANELAMGFPPCAVSVMSFTGAWADLTPASARLEDFHVGRA